MTLIKTPSKVDILILGAGWTSTFLIPLLDQQNITYVATTTTGRDGSLKFKFSYGDTAELTEQEDLKQYHALPVAKTILVTFPLKGKGSSTHLHDTYLETHDLVGDKDKHLFIQLGSTGIFSIEGQDLWVTRHSKYNTANDRAIAEDELLKLNGCVMNLSGLWGGERQPIHWIDRVAATKEQLSGKKSLHMVHGLDVSRGIIGVHRKPQAARGERWMLTDLIVYDWWPLILGFAGELDEINKSDERREKQIKWVGELMEEQGVKALPRSMAALGRCYDTREFWQTFGVWPARARI